MPCAASPRSPRSSRSSRWRCTLARLAGAALLAATRAALAAEPALGHGSQDALHAVGPQSGHVLWLWRLTLGVSTIVFALVLLAFLIALWRAPRATPQTPPDTRSLSQPEQRLARSVTTAVVFSALGLFVLIGASVWTDRAVARMSLHDALHLRIVAHQWWWQVEYDDPQPSRIFQTANELHVPAGRPVIATLEADDVIHSFWAPNIAGKKDLIPGRTSDITLRVDRPGTYRGQCAEFCGAQHAWMGFLVIADPPAQYEAWAAAQRQSATPPTDPLLRRGQQVFLNSDCVMCHNISGTDASARRAPDLTHFGSRQTLAAGTLRNDPADLAAWITDPQKIKPGTNMPGQTFSREDIGALVAYLESLK
jgi:cytochrome c oxidase subunit 2